MIRPLCAVAVFVILARGAQRNAAGAVALSDAELAGSASR